MKEQSASPFARIRRLKFLLPVLVIAAVLGVRTYTRIAASKELDRALVASGTIEATEADISPEVSGRIVEMLVDEGDSVIKGQVIAVLDDEEIRAQVEQARGNLTTAQARLSDLLAGTREEQVRQARANHQKALSNAQGARDIYGTTSESYSKSTELRAQLASAEANYKAAIKEREAAEARLALVKEGPRKEEVSRLQANLQQAQAQLKLAEEDYKRYAALYKEGAISGQQFDNALAKRDSQRAARDAAEAQHREALAGSRPEEIKEAQARLAQAQARVTGAKQSLEAAKQIYADRLQSRQQMESARTNHQSSDAQVQAAKAELDLLLAGATRDTIEAARGQVEQTKGALAAAENRLRDTAVVAPEDGVVTDRFREVGEFVTPGSPVIRVAKMDQVWLRVYAPLPSLGKVNVGQQALVQADTYPGKHYAGRVSSISQEPEFTPKNVQTNEERVKLVYAIRIDLENKSRELKPGMPADATIEFDDARAVVRHEQ